MDTLTIILATLALLAFVALAFMSGYELGTTNGIDTERALANKRVNGLLADLNTRKPKSQRAKRKASRKAVQA